MTDRYAVIGNPIAHSKSPLIHKMFAQQTGQDISYEAVLAPLDGFAATIERLRGEGCKGCNVTVPFKFEALKLTTEPSERARLAQAVNTLKFEGDAIIGDNTDGAGLIKDIENNFRFQLQDKQVLLMGTGGAAYGAAAALAKVNAKLVMLGYRTKDKAQMLATQFNRHEELIHIVGYPDIQDQFDVVINATSSGLSDEMPPLSPTIFAHGALAYDMMYGRETPFMKFAREHGAATVADGLGMLVEQAAEAFYIWRGVRPDSAPVIAALRNQK
ncbi:MAG: shikimate dehydrogenase [Gallionella sp.]|nr:MAG: shikimate dehydrogenase [Gallionella sp.]